MDLGRLERCGSLCFQLRHIDGTKYDGLEMRGQSNEIFGVVKVMVWKWLKSREMVSAIPCICG